ncbi:MAG: nickel insertion protein [Pseudoramibacter sp.]
MRSFPVDRAVLPRTVETVATPWGPAKVKVTTRGGKRRGVPEFDTVDQLAQAAGLPFPDVYAAVLSAWQAQS